MYAEIRHADALNALRELPDNSVDAIVTDPPYGLRPLPEKVVRETIAHWLTDDPAYVPRGRGFMGNAWDRFVPPPALWAEAYRVLKPGGFLTAFAGARTYDLMALSIRLGGFEVRDLLPWLRGDVFPKTPYALKSGHEPVCLAQKKLDGTIENNLATWGVGALGIESCRTPYLSAADEAESKTKNAHGKFGTRHGGNTVYGNFGDEAREDYNPPGRWPANVLLSESAAALLDAQNPVTRSRKGAPRAGEHGDGWGMTHTGTEHDDVGGPSRFFPRFADEELAPFHYAGRAPAKERPVSEDGTKHDTVKPLSVMRWLVRLTCPEGGLVLDMHAGSGTTLEASLLEGRRALAIEAEERYIPLIQQRLARTRAAS